jgi:hypothetical protein
MTKNTALSVALDIVAVYRLTKLVNTDKIAEPLRDKVAEWFPPVRNQKTKLMEMSLPAYFVNCPWCVSIWAGAVIFTLRRISPEAADWVSGILAASAVTGVSSSKGI